MNLLSKVLPRHDPEHEQLRQELRLKKKRIEQMLELDMMTEGTHGETIVDVSTLSHEWSEFAPGMDLRLAEIDGFTTGTVVKCRVHGPQLMPRHWHREAESVFLISGTMRDEETGKVIHAGESMFFRARQWHQPNYLEESYALLLWIPPLITAKANA